MSNQENQVYDVVNELVNKSSRDCSQSESTLREYIDKYKNTPTVSPAQAASIGYAVHDYLYMSSRYRARLDVLQCLTPDSDLDDLYIAVKKARANIYREENSTFDFEAYLSQLNYILRKVQDACLCGDDFGRQEN